MRTVVASFHLFNNAIYRARILEGKAASKSISQDLIRQVANKQALLFEQHSLQLIRAVERLAIRQLTSRINRFAGFFGPPPSDHIVIFQCEPERVNPAMAACAGRIIAMLSQTLPQCMNGRTLYLFQCRNIGEAGVEAGFQASHPAATCRAAPGWSDADARKRPGSPTCLTTRRDGCPPGVQGVAAVIRYPDEAASRSTRITSAAFWSRL